MKMPITAFVSPAQRFPSKCPRATTFNPSSCTSPYRPSRMCQASTPSQSPYVGASANVHGQGIPHLHTSNQSPVTRHSGTSAICLPPPWIHGPAANPRRTLLRAHAQRQAAASEHRVQAVLGQKGLAAVDVVRRADPQVEAKRLCRLVFTRRTAAGLDELLGRSEAQPCEEHDLIEKAPSPGLCP